MIQYNMWVGSLVRELKFHMSYSAVKKIRLKNLFSYLNSLTSLSLVSFAKLILTPLTPATDSCSKTVLSNTIFYNDKNVLYTVQHSSQ